AFSTTKQLHSPLQKLLFPPREEILVDFPLPTNLSSAFFALQPLQHCFKLKFRAECPSFLPCHFQLSPSSPQFYDFLSLLSRNWVALHCIWHRIAHEHYFVGMVKLRLRVTP